MCAGCTIHLIKDYQDIRLMRIGHSKIPFILSIILVCNLSLCGLPFIRGFYSKDIILEHILINNNSILMVLLILGATILTLAYSLRITLILGIRYNKIENLSPATHIDFFIFTRVLVLFPFSISAGFVTRWYIYINPILVFFPAWLKLAIPVCLILGWILRWNKYLNHRIINLIQIKNFIKNIFFLPFTIRVFYSNKFLYYGKNHIYKIRGQMDRANII